jgi:serine/threonine protein kinase
VLLQCSRCKRSFREPGFCPFDGVRLDDVTEAPRLTVESAHYTAQPGATINNPTELDERNTLPLTPSSPAANPPASGSAPASTQTQPGVPSAPKPPAPATGGAAAIKIISAADNTDTAIRALRVRTEYDKLVGETLDGRYFVQRKIGEGGMGVVFAVRHAVIERPLAIKVLKREVMRDDATIRRFVQEARAASRIGHPNIVDVTDFGKTAEGLTYQVMEWIDGETLSHTIRHQAPFGLVRVIRIAAQIARALGVAHDKGIVHRDLKPENVFLVDRDNRPDFVKIVDFGIAKVAPLPGEAAPNQPRLTKAGSVFGTPEYMAPEQAAGRGDTDGRVDIYALGIITYEMLTGTVPHKGDSMVRTLAMQMLDPIVPPSQARPDLEISPAAEAVVMKALAKKRDQRYQTMGELLAALDALAKTALPAPSGQSATGSPIYQLTPLPPGATDSTVMKAAGRQLEQAAAAAPVSAAVSAQLPASASQVSQAQPLPVAPLEVEATAPATQPSQRRIKNEPQFVTSTRPAQFVITDEPPPERPRPRFGLAVLTLVALAGVTGAAVFVIVQNRSGAPIAAADAGAREVPRADATLVAQLAPDAAMPGPADAALPVPTDAAELAPDASVRVRVPIALDGGVRGGRHRDAGPPAVPPGVDPTRKVRITVMTKADGAGLYVGTSYHGPSGTSLEEPFGTRYEVECRAPGYKSGRIWLTFDGTREIEMCPLTRVKICIDNIKNPFDDCELDPTKPSIDRSQSPPPKTP